jgi:predicted RNA-binding protein with PUA-like domain
MRSPVTLDDIKLHPELEDIALIRQSRLSVMPLSKKELKIILKLGDTSVRGV